MAVVKDIARPTSQHRPSFSSAASSLPNRQSYNRPHSHSTSSGSFNTHRVTRRKSTTLNPASNPAALSAAVNIALEAEADGNKSSNRRSISSRTALGSLTAGSYPSPPNSFPNNPNSLQYGRRESVMVDGPSLASMTEKANGKNRFRRASESSSLNKKKASNGELKCETCGKGYKHSSCLTKHLWEHTPEWTITSKLLISKHQQVQLLEAASVLVGMNLDGPDALKAIESDNSSASPAASGSSDLRDDDISSAETTPPPQGDAVYGHHKHYSTTSTDYSRSYQSVFSTSADVGPGDYYHRRHWSTSSQNRPVTAGTSIAESYPEEDQADLAAAVGLLSCSYGTPQSGPVALPADVPPVPPLPAKYQGMSSSFQPLAKLSNLRETGDVDMEEESSSEDDDRSQHNSHRFSRIEDDDGIFGMEE